MPGFLTAVIWVSILLAQVAHAQTSFYQGKTITLVAGTEPGGTLDMRTKALTPFLRKYIPGDDLMDRLTTLLRERAGSVLPGGS